MKIFSWLMLPCLLLLFPCSSSVAVAQTSAPVASAPVWTMQNSGVTASLRGIHSVDGKIAWASGSGGTVLRTVDGGEHWTKCEIPDGKKDGGKLDFRGVQAWDAQTAIVMASGPGELSRLYKTTDGCKSWKLVFMNPDKDGFWDGIVMGTAHRLGMVVGDPVKNRFQLYITYDSGDSWAINDHLPKAKSNESAFAASNSIFGFVNANYYLVTGGTSTRLLFYEGPYISVFKKATFHQKTSQLPLNHSKTSGAFSINFAGEFQYHEGKISYAPYAISVGGDYAKPNESLGTAAWSADGGLTWTASEKPPHGYRSTVQWSEPLKIWIAAGTNGSDVSRDDGKTWTPLDDGNWNALSLPFIVGPNGRIGKLNENALPH